MPIFFLPRLRLVPYEPIITVVSELAERTSLKVRPGLAADRSPGAAAFLVSVAKDDTHLPDAMGQSRIHIEMRSAEMVGPSAGEHAGEPQKRFLLGFMADRQSLRDKVSRSKALEYSMIFLIELSETQ